MLTRTTTRRSAVVLTVALVAMLLVALSGSARAAHNRVSAGTGQSIASPLPARQAAAILPAAHDHAPWHLDLAATPPAEGDTVVALAGVPVEQHDTSATSRDDIAAVGRAPPAR